jgi:hypothetical protein
LPIPSHSLNAMHDWSISCHPERLRWLECILWKIHHFFPDFLQDLRFLLDLTTDGNELMLLVTTEFSKVVLHRCAERKVEHEAVE